MTRCVLLKAAFFLVVVFYEVDDRCVWIGVSELCMQQERDRQTDRQTDGRGTRCPSMSSYPGFLAADRVSLVFPGQGLASVAVPDLRCSSFFFFSSLLVSILSYTPHLTSSHSP